MHPEDQFGVRAIRAGAEGYVTKDAPAKDLLNAVRKITAGGRYVTPLLAELMASALSTASPDQSVDALSDRELQILRMITVGRSPGDIATELQLSIKTVSTYRSRLLEKLQLKTTADLIRFGLQNGLDA
jgi:DNA-binding NarL/FixJ family response regulator